MVIGWGIFPLCLLKFVDQRVDDISGNRCTPFADDLRWIAIWRPRNSHWAATSQSNLQRWDIPTLPCRDSHWNLAEHTGQKYLRRMTVVGLGVVFGGAVQFAMFISRNLGVQHDFRFFNMLQYSYNALSENCLGCQWLSLLQLDPLLFVVGSVVQRSYSDPSFPPVIKGGNLKSPVNGGFNRKITELNNVSSSQPCLIHRRILHLLMCPDFWVDFIYLTTCLRGTCLEITESSVHLRSHGLQTPKPCLVVNLGWQTLKYHRVASGLLHIRLFL